MIPLQQQINTNLPLITSHIITDNKPPETSTQESLLNITNMLKCDKSLSDSDVKRGAEIMMIVNNAIDSGTIVYSPSPKTEEQVPPFGTARYSAEERESRLQQIAALKTGCQQEKIEPGCSLILNLLADEIYESYLVVRRNKLFQSPYAKMALGDYKAYIDSLIGLMSTVNLGKFQGTSRFTRNIPHSSRQGCFVVTRQSFLSDEGVPVGKTPLFQKNFINNPESKRFSWALYLLEDLVTQEMHRLYSPINDPADLSQHFSRLHRRADCFLRVLRDKEEYNTVEKSLLKKHSSLLNRQNAALIEFCNTFITKLDKLRKKNNPQDLADLWKCLESVNQDPETLKDRFVLTSQMTVELKNSPNDVDLTYFFRLSLKNKWSFQSLFEESYFVLLTILINASQVSNQEIDTCIENLIEVSKAIINHKKEHIETCLKELPQGPNTKVLSDIWKMSFELGRKNNFLPGIDQLEKRLQDCLNAPKDQGLRALAIRDALNLLSSPILIIKRQLNSVIYNLETTLLLDKEKNSEHIKLFQELCDLNLMQMEAINAATEGIKALVGRCFLSMEFHSQINEEKAIKAFEVKSQRARQTGQDLVNSEKKVTKRKQKSLQPIRVEEVKIQPKAPQKNISSPKSLHSERSHKALLKEIRPSIAISQKSKSTIHHSPSQFSLSQPPLNIAKTKKQIVSLQEKHPEASVSLLKCETLLKKLKNSPFVNENCWQNNSIENLNFLLESLIETLGKAEFAVDLIFEQTNLLRRSIEALLVIATIYSGTSNDEIQSIGHDTEGLLGILIKNTNVPENIRKLLWNMRKVPESFAEANRCVNYPAEMNTLWKRLGEDSRQLLNFLIQVDREGSTQNKDEALRTSLTVQQNCTLQRTAYFMERLLTALCDPSSLVDGDLPPMIYPLKNHKKDFTKSESFALESITTSHIASEDFIDPEKMNILSINCREEALSAIDTALVWISIRCMAPVEGSHAIVLRTTERNIALRNCGIYMRRLKEKLGPDRSNRPMSTTLGQCELIRRAQKELSIAALYHTDSFVDGEHIVQARDIRFANSPCFLMSILRSVSTRPKELPAVGNWMHRAHQILSYPASQDIKESDLHAFQLQKLIQDVRKASKELRLAASDETLILANSKHKTPDKRLKERNMLVTTNENARIFPGLAAFLHTLKFGLSLPKHKHLS